MVAKFAAPARTQWPKETLLWAAGLLEGEGSFVTRGDRNGGRILMSTTDEDVALKIATLLGVGKVAGPYHRPPAKDCWNFKVEKTLEVVPLATALRPFMGRRRQGQIDTMLAHISLR